MVRNAHIRRFRNQWQWRLTKRVMRVRTPSTTLVNPDGFAFSDSEKAESLAGSLGTQFQSVTDHSVLTVIEMVDVALKSYFLTPDSDLN